MVGMAGLVGAGRTEVLSAIFGVIPGVAGTVLVDDQLIPPGNCPAAIDRGIAMVPEDRKAQGLILPWGVRQNISLPGLKRYRIAGAGISLGSERRDSKRMISEMQIKTANDHSPVSQLSGGNQQKVVIGKWLAMNPRVLLLDEPTRGVDIGAKQEIYRLMETLAKSGVAILFASSDMEEVLGMADRILVMHEGTISGELSRDQATEESVMNLATGLTTGLPSGTPQSHRVNP